MTTNFADLKKSRKASLEKIIQETTKVQGPGQQEDTSNFWTPTVDKAGNGYAVIRFLPAPQGEDLPWVRVFNHGFQGPGGWYIENSLTTLNKKDPVSEYNTMLWNSGIEANKDQVRKQKRRLTYISNIYVVKDPANPDNEGKVMLFKYGKKIFDKINEAMNPQFEDEEAVNPFDLWEGADFKMKIRNVEGYRNYDKSEFDSPSPLLDDDEKLEKVWAKEQSLQEFLDAKNFKSYEELKAKLDRVLGLTANPAAAKRADDAEPQEEWTPPPQSRATAAPKAAKEEAPWSGEEDDEMSYFEKLAKDD